MLLKSFIVAKRRFLVKHVSPSLRQLFCYVIFKRTELKSIWQSQHLAIKRSCYCFLRCATLLMPFNRAVEKTRLKIDFSIFFSRSLASSLNWILLKILIYSKSFAIIAPMCKFIFEIHLTQIEIAGQKQFFKQMISILKILLFPISVILSVSQTS